MNGQHSRKTQANGFIVPPSCLVPIPDGFEACKNNRDRKTPSRNSFLLVSPKHALGSGLNPSPSLTENLFLTPLDRALGHENAIGHNNPTLLVSPSKNYPILQLSSSPLRTACLGSPTRNPTLLAASSSPPLTACLGTPTRNPTLLPATSSPPRTTFLGSILRMAGPSSPVVLRSPEKGELYLEQGRRFVPLGSLMSGEINPLSSPGLKSHRFSAASGNPIAEEDLGGTGSQEGFGPGFLALDPCPTSNPSGVLPQPEPSGREKAATPSTAALLCMLSAQVTAETRSVSESTPTTTTLLTEKADDGRVILSKEFTRNTSVSTCPLCKKKIRDRNGLIVHIKTVHKGTWFSCKQENCPFTGQSPREVLQHNKRHNREKRELATRPKPWRDAAAPRPKRSKKNKSSSTPPPSS